MGNPESICSQLVVSLVSLPVKKLNLTIRFSGVVQESVPGKLSDLARYVLS